MRARRFILEPRLELGTSNTIEQTFLSAKKSWPVNFKPLRAPCASKENGSLRQPAKKRWSQASFTVAWRPGRDGRLLDDNYAFIAHAPRLGAVNPTDGCSQPPSHGRREAHAERDIRNEIAVGVDHHLI